MQRPVVVHFTGSATVDVPVPDSNPDDTTVSDVLYWLQQKDAAELNIAVTDWHFAEDAS